MDQFEICTKLLKSENGVQAKLQILDFLLGITGSEEGLNTLYEMADTIVEPLIDITYHSNKDIAEKAIQVLLNMSAESKGAQILFSIRLTLLSTTQKQNTENVNSSDHIFSGLLDHIFSESSLVTEYAIMILVNLSRDENMARKFFENLKHEDVIKTISALALRTNHKYDYLPSLLANLTQLPEVRATLLEQSNCGVLGKLITLIDYKDAAIRRNGTLSIVRNLCFSIENHKFLLDPKINLLARILLPLAGPEEYDEEDNDKLPLDLQYLPADKTREPEASIRKMLLEIIMQLCTTSFAREVLRKYNAYVILREYHKWETNDKCLATCEDVVNILIRTEEEIGIDNLGNVDIPPDLVKKFNELG